MNCPLCYSDSNHFEADTFLCSECDLVFKDQRIHLSKEAEDDRYKSHQNNSTDQGYLDFLGKLVNPLKQFLPRQFAALDFGCGPGPTVSILLEEAGGECENYDPLFFPDAHLLVPETYDVVTSTEVVEHFQTPGKDWELLVSLVKENGILGIMTQMYSPAIDYKSWWYKNDPTHVCFYQEKTFNFLAEKYDLDILYNDNKSVIIFRKRVL